MSAEDGVADSENDDRVARQQVHAGTKRGGRKNASPERKDSESDDDAIVLTDPKDMRAKIKKNDRLELGGSGEKATQLRSSKKRGRRQSGKQVARKLDVDDVGDRTGGISEEEIEEGEIVPKKRRRRSPILRKPTRKWQL